MKMENWHPENSVIDAELATILRTEGCSISEFTITESLEGGFYCTFRLSSDRVYLALGQGQALPNAIQTKQLKKEWMFLATRRARETPRIFMNLTRLTDHIKAKFVGVRDMRLLLLAEEAIEQAKPAAKKASVKVAKKKAVPQKQIKAAARKRGAA